MSSLSWILLAADILINSSKYSRTAGYSGIMYLATISSFLEFISSVPSEEETVLSSEEEKVLTLLSESEF